jgi:hypothetical protein
MPQARFLALALAAFACADLAVVAQSVVENPIYSFRDAPDGSNPASSVVVDNKTGALYGVTAKGGTNSYGTVFKLTPPSGPSGNWTETVLYSFGPAPDGLNPNALVEDQQTGILYGTTLAGGANSVGILFQLTPPTTPGGTWTESVAYNFAPSATDEFGAGLPPAGNLLRDASGNLYGTTTWGGAYAGIYSAFKLSPPTTAGANWNETILYSAGADFLDYNWPLVPSLLLDGQTGALVAAVPTSYTYWPQGALAQLSPPITAGRTWTESAFFQFGAGAVQGGGTVGLVPTGAMVNLGGVLFGTTTTGGSPGGTVYQLSPPQTSGAGWQLQTLHTFLGGDDGLNPTGGLVFTNGVFYGSTSDANTNGFGLPSNPASQSGNGTLFMVTETKPNVFWQETSVYDFLGPPADGSLPLAALTPAPSGSNAQQTVLYGTTWQGGTSNNGTVFQATLPTQPIPPSTFKATCEENCFQNSIGWRLPPPPWILSENTVLLQSTVVSIGVDSRVVTFSVIPQLNSYALQDSAARTLVVTFARPTKIEVGQHWQLFAKGPLTTAKGSQLLGFWKR